MSASDLLETTPALRWSFDNSYARLPDRFRARLDPTPVATPRLVKVNRALAETLGIEPDQLDGAAGAEILAGNRVPQGAEPMAQAYAGHQFGNFVPQLGDGRAILLGEVIGRDGVRRDVQLKGSGPTPFSRRGDGRAALGPVLREYLVSEAMAALGVPTTRALAAAMTGEIVWRETALPGAVLTRVASSHLRIGTFQYFAARGDEEALRILADHAIARHYPEAANDHQPYRALLDGVIARQAELVAQWMSIGFIHGVMNTDNTSISGETIDYGPCAFMDAYDPATVYSAIDTVGRYAYANQPPVMLWNLARLAEAMLGLLGADEATSLASARDALAAYRQLYEAARLRRMRSKLGLVGEDATDVALVDDLLTLMAANGADFTLTFRGLCEGDGAAARVLFADQAAFDEWATRWERRFGADGSLEAIRLANPAFIPRNHLVEAALAAAVERQDFGPFEALSAVLAAPFADRPELARYALPPRPDERVLQTFCGT